MYPTLVRVGDSCPKRYSVNVNFAICTKTTCWNSLETKEMSWLIQMPSIQWKHEPFISKSYLLYTKVSMIVKVLIFLYFSKFHVFKKMSSNEIILLRLWLSEGASAGVQGGPFFEKAYIASQNFKHFIDMHSKITQ